MEKKPELLWIARYDYEPGWILTPHSHDYYQLIYIIDGIGRATIYDEEIIIGQNSILFIAPGVTHGLLGVGESSLQTLDTKFRLDQKSYLADSLDCLPFHIEDTNRCVQKRLDSIRKEGMKKLPFYRTMCDSSMLQILILLCRYQDRSISVISSDSTDNEHIQDPVVLKAVEWMKAHYQENIDITEVGESLGYSAEYLCRKFKQHTNYTPHQYLMRVRIAKAKELLKQPDPPIKEISHMVGFKSIHHFSRIFKEYSGQPPGTWRNKECMAIWKNVTIDPEFVNKDITVTVDGIPPGFATSIAEKPCPASS
ncbi:MAG: AraC family transcriptional regulator [Spirochaetia bacterium]|nr:AraC family transcriptional regulator [Spirochaetia bacterium]MCF7940846.1 AraC family transcriptional regulator [Spirochaetia bacterium]